MWISYGFYSGSSFNPGHVDLGLGRPGLFDLGRVGSVSSWARALGWSVLGTWVSPWQAGMISKS